MYLLPILFSSLLTDINRAQNLIDDNWDNDLFPKLDYFDPFFPINNHPFFPPWFKFWKPEYNQVIIDNNNWKCILNVKLYKPDEIKVRVVDGSVVIEGKHEERQDKHGFISRQFSRRYLLPSEAELDKLTYNISKNGILTVTVPLKKNLETTTENTTEIESSDKPSVTQNVTEKSTDKEVTKEDLNSTTPKDTIHETSAIPKNTLQNTTPKE